MVRSLAAETVQIDLGLYRKLAAAKKAGADLVVLVVDSPGGYVDESGNMAGVLRDTDWASMAHSLEVRVPLVDSKLLGSLAPITAGTALRSKQLLADSLSVPLPSSVIDRPKTGFTTPVQSWLQRDNRIQQWRRVPALALKKCPWARRWA